MTELVTQAQLAKALSLTTRQIRNLAEERVFVGQKSGTRMLYPFVASVVAFFAWKAKKAELLRPANLETARAEKMQADAELAKLTLAERRGELIPLAMHVKRVRSDHERADAVIRGGLSEFLGEGVSRETLDRIADKIQRALVKAAEDIIPVDADEEESAA